MAWRWPFRLRFRIQREPLGSITDPWASAPSASERQDSPISVLLSQIEAAACAVYARNDLPDRRGHYARSSTTGAWRFVSEALSAEERWALFNAQRPGSGWRFGTLEDLGDKPDNPAEVRQAAQALRNCHALRTRLAEGGSPSLGDELEAAIRLGSAWRQLAETRPAPAREEPLRLSVPKPQRAPRKPRAKRAKP